MGKGRQGQLRQRMRTKKRGLFFRIRIITLSCRFLLLGLSYLADEILGHSSVAQEACILHFAFCILHFAFCILQFAICNLQFAICILHFASPKGFSIGRDPLFVGS